MELIHFALGVTCAILNIPGLPVTLSRSTTLQNVHAGDRTYAYFPHLERTVVKSEEIWHIRDFFGLLFFRTTF